MRAEKYISLELYLRVGCIPSIGAMRGILLPALIGVMRWMVEIGCIDINTKVPIIIIFICAKMRAYGNSASCHGLFEAQT